MMAETSGKGESAYDLYARGCSMLSGGHPHQAVMLLSRAKLLEPEKASIREALEPSSRVRRDQGAKVSEELLGRRDGLGDDLIGQMLIVEDITPMRL